MTHQERAERKVRREFWKVDVLPDGRLIRQIVEVIGEHRTETPDLAPVALELPSETVDHYRDDNQLVLSYAAAAPLTKDVDLDPTLPELARRMMQLATETLGTRRPLQLLGKFADANVVTYVHAQRAPGTRLRSCHLWQPREEVGEICGVVEHRGRLRAYAARLEERDAGHGQRAWRLARLGVLGFG